MLPFWLLPLPLRIRLSGMLALSLLVGNCLPSEGLAEYKGKKEIVVGELVSLDGPAGSAWKITPRELGSNTKQSGSTFTFAVRADKVPAGSIFVENLKIVQLEGGGQGIDYDEWEYVIVSGPAPPVPPPGPGPKPPGPGPTPPPADWISELREVMQSQLMANPPPKEEALFVAKTIREKAPPTTDVSTLMQAIRQARMDAMKADRFLAWNNLIEPVGVHIEKLQTAGTIKGIEDQKKALLSIADALEAWASSRTITASLPACGNPLCLCEVCECDACNCKGLPVAASVPIDPTDAKLDKLLESNDRLAAILEKHLLATTPTPATPQKPAPAPPAAAVITQTVAPTYSSGQNCYTLPNGQRVCSPSAGPTYSSSPGRVFRWGR